jgi:hypothetical protein
MTNWRLALVSLLTVACGAHERVPGQDQAEIIVWRSTYQSQQSPPAVIWIHKKDLNCDGGDAFYAYDNFCVYGVYAEGGDAEVALRGDGHISQTSYAHELLHAYLYDTTGTPTNHETPEWQPGGLLSIAQQALIASGL